MIIKAVQVNTEQLGAQMAAMTSDEQAAFFKGFASELKTWPSSYQRSMQFFYVGELLTDEHKRLLLEFVESICYKKN